MDWLRLWEILFFIVGVILICVGVYTEKKSTWISGIVLVLGAMITRLAEWIVAT